jgi:hypothetical protein
MSQHADQALSRLYVRPSRSRRRTPLERLPFTLQQHYATYAAREPHSHHIRGRAGIATKMRYAFGMPHQGFHRRRLPNAMPQRQHTS